MDNKDFNFSEENAEEKANAENAEEVNAEKKEKVKITGKEKKQKRLIKKTRGGVVLSEDEVKEIKAGRKKLRHDMKEQGIRSRKEFELTASSLGLYFDKNRFFGFLWWFITGHGLWFLLGALAAFFGSMALMSMITQMRGHFTINMTRDLLKKGFSMSETVGFENPMSHLYSDPVYDAPCISIAMLPDDLDDIDGSHNGTDHFAYTFYVRNEGETPVGYNYQVKINSESLNLSSATWVMLFEDGKMKVFARAREDGSQECLPSIDDNARGYVEAPYIDAALEPDKLYSTIAINDKYTFYRIAPYRFESSDIVTTGAVEHIQPLETHKYTVVIWLEGDDPDCNDDLIGGHIGLEMNFKLIDETEYE